MPSSEEAIDLIDDDSQRHICVVSHKATVRERVGGPDVTLFDFPAGSFFQNNNSILGPLTTYVQNAIFRDESTAQDDTHTRRTRAPTHLVDTYCGSGLFSITLSKHFKYVAGIEIDANAISCAKRNLTLNNLDVKYDDGKKKHEFHAGKSEDIFASVLSGSAEPFPANGTVVIIDPPRKGCDVNFIEQLTA
jgi:tRNA (uracil-5-)-methyltransferase